MYLQQTNVILNWQGFNIASTSKKKCTKINPFNNISMSFNPLYVLENSHKKITALGGLISNAELK